MSVILLHISDIHIKSASDPILKRGKEIASSIYSLLPSASHIFIVVSGDIAFSGEAEQYDLATKLFNEILLEIQKETATTVTFIVTPGNHDCDFNLNNGARTLVVQSLEKAETPVIDDSIINTCSAIQQPFFAQALQFHDLQNHQKRKCKASL